MALNHTVQGSVNYTVVGSPTIVDGVVSGFSGSNYLQTSASFTYNSSTPFEFYCRFKTPPTLESNAYGPFICLDSFEGKLFGLQLTSSMKRVNFRFAFYQSTLCQAIASSNYDYQVDTWYRAKATVDNGLCKVQVFDDNNNIVQEAQSTFTFGDVTYRVLFMAANALSDASWGSSGSIDLNSTYIKVNGQAWFGVCPVEVKHINYGTSVGYTKVGSPTISNGVVSGFSGSDYLRTSQGLPSSIQELEICLNYSNWVDGRIIRYSTDGSGKAYELRTYGEYFRFDVTTGFYYSNKKMEDYSFVKVLATNNFETVNMFVSNNGNTWEEATLTYVSETHDASTNQMMLGYNLASNTTINLNHTYIKVNGKLWFYKPSTNYLVKDNKLVFADSGLYLSGPVNYEVVGSPTITDGVVSGFSGSNYLKTSASFTYNSSTPFEFYCRFKTPPTLESNAFGPVICLDSFEGRLFGLQLTSSFKRVSFRFAFYQSTLCQAIASSNYDYQVDTWYRAKATVDNGLCKVQVFDDNNNIVQEAQSTFTFGDVTYRVLFMAANSLSDLSWGSSGSIDLNSTYIKVNGSLWFYGKNYASGNIAPVPAGYTFGNTTTTAIGLVDMRTQQFTAAPSGATLGKNE